MIERIDGQDYFVFGGNFDCYRGLTEADLPKSFGRTGEDADSFMRHLYHLASINRAPVFQNVPNEEANVYEEYQSCYDSGYSRLRQLVAENRDVDAGEIAREVSKKVAQGCPIHDIETEGMELKDAKPINYGATTAIGDRIWESFCEELESTYLGHGYNFMDITRQYAGQDDVILGIERNGLMGKLLMIDFQYMRLAISQFYSKMRITGLGGYEQQVKAVLDKACRERRTQLTSNWYQIAEGLMNISDIYYSLAGIIANVFATQFGYLPSYEEFMEIFDDSHRLVNLLSAMHVEDFFDLRRSLKISTEMTGSVKGDLWLMNPKNFIIARNPKGKLSIGVKPEMCENLRGGHASPQLGCPLKNLNRKFFPVVREHIADIALFLQDFNSASRFTMDFEYFY